MTGVGLCRVTPVDESTATGHGVDRSQGALTLPVCSGRCVVRRFRATDIDAFMAYRNDLVWMRHQGYKGLTRSEYEAALLAEPQVADGA